MNIPIPAFEYHHWQFIPHASDKVYDLLMQEVSQNRSFKDVIRTVSRYGKKSIAALLFVPEGNKIDSDMAVFNVEGGYFLLMPAWKKVIINNGVVYYNNLVLNGKIQSIRPGVIYDPWYHFNHIINQGVVKHVNKLDVAS